MLYLEEGCLLTCPQREVNLRTEGIVLITDGCLTIFSDEERTKLILHPVVNRIVSRTCPWGIAAERGEIRGREHLHRSVRREGSERRPRGDREFLYTSDNGNIPRIDGLNSGPGERSEGPLAGRIEGIRGLAPPLLPVAFQHKELPDLYDPHFTTSQRPAFREPTRRSLP